MKKLALFAFASFILSTGLMGQKMTNIKTDLFSPFLRTGVLKVERALNEDMSLQLGFFYTGYSRKGNRSSQVIRFRNYPRIQVTTFPIKTGSGKGTYLAPNFRYMKLTAEEGPVNNDEGIPLMLYEFCH